MKPPPVDQPPAALTQRQTEILNLMGVGHSDAEIAAHFHISEATVRTHIHHILQRLNLDSALRRLSMLIPRRTQMPRIMWSEA
ncbi:MAG: response regulator transcription factor [Chloroflexi bacterium]|nr:response regulator transcription factor [Chloroflexota bacterium]